ncbi:MAG: hypothetical protein N4A49_15020 [Marinifilaceae bacterium]|jgi:hypothetical protein|nr:hypothetical protein [Marinifilaceae bacterium]
MKIVKVLVLVFFAFICTYSNAQSDLSKAVSIDKMMKTAEKNIGKEICVYGKVKHVCSHSGRRLFLANKKADLSLRVNTYGKIKSFNRELSGSNIKLKGILRQQTLSKEDIDKLEERITEQSGHCGTENNSIKKMRDWMKKNNKKEYYIYYVDCVDYEQIYTK